MSGGGGGNEGDVLLLGALRHSGMCPIPDDIQTIGQVAAKPELLVGLLPCLSVGPRVGDEGPVRLLLVLLSCCCRWRSRRGACGSSATVR